MSCPKGGGAKCDFYNEGGRRDWQKTIYHDKWARGAQQQVILYDKEGFNKKNYLFYKEWHVCFCIMSRAIASLKGHSFNISERSKQ